jgi:pimeloyl-ACP methyl ester carboxylesterase
VAHESTAPGNVGQAVALHVRELDGRGGTTGAAVVMVQSRSFPALAGYQLEHGGYDWARWLAQAGGLDVFIVDFQGSGLSPRPRMSDPCNAPAAQQTALLVPNPLAAPCDPTNHPPYAFQPYTIGSDLAELDTVVEFVRRSRGVEKVHLVAWSQGSFRAGPYAVAHPEKVASLLLFAPIFNPGFRPTEPPATLPAPGVAMNVRTRANLFRTPPPPALQNVGWDAELRCEDQREPWIEDAVWAAVMENDDLGRTWGPPEGLLRVREVTLWGWNATVAANLTVPTLIIQGQFDTGQGARQELAVLYDLVKNENKLRFRVQCAGHFMAWERQRKVLHRVSRDWITRGEVGGFAQGQFFVDTEGDLWPCEPAGTTDLNRCLVEQ